MKKYPPVTQLEDIYLVKKNKTYPIFLLHASLTIYNFIGFIRNKFVYRKMPTWSSKVIYFV